MTPRPGQSLGGRPVTEIVTPVNMGNRLHCDNGEGVATASPLPSRLKRAGISRVPISRPLHGLHFLSGRIPAVNCWAIVSRPLTADYLNCFCAKPLVCGGSGNANC